MHNFCIDHFLNYKDIHQWTFGLCCPITWGWQYNHKCTRRSVLYELQWGKIQNLVKCSFFFTAVTGTDWGEGANIATYLVFLVWNANANSHLYHQCQLHVHFWAKQTSLEQCFQKQIGIEIKSKWRRAEHINRPKIK